MGASLAPGMNVAEGQARLRLAQKRAAARESAPFHASWSVGGRDHCRARLVSNQRRSTALEQTDEAREPVRAGLLHERRGMHLWWRARSEDGLADVEQAVRLIPAQSPSADRARALAGLGFMLMLTDRHTRAREVCEEALDVARTVGARAAEVRALSTLGSSLIALGDRTAGMASQRRARALACELGEPHTLAQTAAVSHILEKLGASTRTEAAGAAHRLGLVPLGRPHI